MNFMRSSVDDFGIKTSELDVNIETKKVSKLIINNENTEIIAREVLNNSIYHSIGKKPFVAPRSEEKGQSDNIGNNYSIDTKLLMIESDCYLIGRNQLSFNNSYGALPLNANDYIYAYRALVNGAINVLSNDIRDIASLLDKIRLTMLKYDKNIMFINIYPQRDILDMDDKFSFELSPLKHLFWVMSDIKRRSRFSYDILVAYPFVDNTYNLISISEVGFVAESFIKSNSQIESIEAGLDLKVKEGSDLALEVDKEKDSHIITRCNYKKLSLDELNSFENGIFII